MLRDCVFTLSVCVLTCVADTVSGQDLDQWLRENAVAKGFSGSVLVDRGGEILLHATYGQGMDWNSAKEPAYWIASSTKQLTSGLIVQLAAQGKIEFEAPITRYLDDVPSDKQNITIRSLLTNSSGIGQNYAAEGLVDREVAMREILKYPLTAEPGTAYVYSNDGYTLLAIIAEIVTGESYEDLMTRYVIEPLGLIETGFWGRENTAKMALVPDSNALNQIDERIFVNGRSIENWGYRGATGIYSTSADLHAWLTRLLQSMKSDGDALAAIAQPEFFVRNVEGLGSVYYGFGLAVVVQDGEWTMLSHIGDDDWLGHNSTITAVPNGDIVVVLSNSGYLEDGTPWSAQVNSDIRGLIKADL